MAGMSGKVIMNENGSREPEYYFTGLNTSGGVFNFAIVATSGLDAVCVSAKNTKNKALDIYSTIHGRNFDGLGLSQRRETSLGEKRSIRTQHFRLRDAASWATLVLCLSHRRTWFM